MENNEMQTGLWSKVSQSGNKYCSGVITIGDMEYWVNLFKNDKKGNDKAPDYRIILNEKGQVEQKAEEDVTPADFEDGNGGW